MNNACILTENVRIFFEKYWHFQMDSERVLSMQRHQRESKHFAQEYLHFLQNVFSFTKNVAFARLFTHLSLFFYFQWLYNVRARQIGMFGH